MAYLLPTSLVFGHNGRGLNINQPIPASQPSPRARYRGVRNWMASGKTSDSSRTHVGYIGTGFHPLGQPVVVSAWGGSGKSATDVEGNSSRKPQIEQWRSKHNRRAKRQQAATEEQYKPFGRNVKLVFLKDSADSTVSSVRSEYLLSIFLFYC